MNILLITETYLPWITGVSVSTDNIARYLVSRGHHVTIVCPTPVAKGKIPPIKNCKVIFVPAYPFKIYHLRAVAIFPLALLKMRQIFKENKFDVVHIQEPGETGIAALIEAKRHHVPVVGYLHFIPDQMDIAILGSAHRVLTPFFNVYVRFIYEKYDAVMTPSHFFKNYLKFLSNKIHADVVSNGVDIRKFAPRSLNLEFRKKYKIDAKKILFLYLGRLDGDKNVGTLIRATKYTRPNVHLLIIGKGNLRALNHYIARSLRVEDKITWIDYITNEEMPEAYNASDGFTLMSPYEGQSIVTLQAAASGLPIIAASAGALPEICRDGENGFLVHTYDYKTLAEKMNQLADDKSLRERFGKESRKISLLHDRPKVMHQLEVIYERIISGKQDKRKFPVHQEST